MPRSSRHKSSKHGSRDARDYSDPEKESTLRERKSKEESSGATVSKESVSGEKRKFDSKEHYDSLNGEYYEEQTSSKRLKEKKEDSGNDRWNGGDDEKGETLNKSKTSSEKSRRREEVEGEDTKKSSGTSDGKYKESSRRESKEFEKDRDQDKERKHKAGKTDKLSDCEDHHGSNIVPGKTDLKLQDQLQSPGSENYPEKRSRRKKEHHGSGHKYQDNIDDASDRVFTSVDGCVKVGKHKEEKCRDEKYRDKNRVDTEEANKQRGDKQGDDQPDKEHPRSDGKDVSESNRKKTNIQENDHDEEHGHEPDSEVDGYHDRPREYKRNRDYEREYDQGRVRERDERDRDRDHGRDRDRDFDRRDYERDRYHEQDWDREQSTDRDRDHDRDRTHDREKYRSRDYYRNRRRSKTEHERESDRDASYLDQSGRYRNCRERRRSPDDQDDLSDSKSRITTAHTDMDTRGSRGQPDGDRIRSQCQLSSLVVQEETGNYLDQKAREAADLCGGSERGSKNRVFENTAKTEDGSLGEFQVERSSTTKASPRPLVEETGQRNNTRDFSASEADRILVDETLQAEVSFNNKANQNISSFPWSGISSPKVGPLEEDSRVNMAGRYKRSDANTGRGQQSNVWRGSPNWPSPVVPNGFIPFQHGPPHGGFQSMMPQFPSPSLFGVRPSMDMSHSGIPYHMANTERFSGHVRPLGWQNIMMDVSSPHMHGFFGEMSNGVFRDESRMYGGVEWDHNRRMHGRGWDSGADAWKTQNVDVSMDVSSISVKDDNSAQAIDADNHAVQTSNSEYNRAKSIEAGSNLTSPAKELAVSSPKILFEEAYVDTVAETLDPVEQYCRHYLSKLDISVNLTDAELHSQCMVLFEGEEGSTSDDKIAVFVNLKEGGKAVVPKSDRSSLTSLIPTENNSVFQIAMELYKEQRYEMKGLPDVKYDEGSQVSPPDLDDDTKTNMEVDCMLLEIGEASELHTPQKVEQEAASTGILEIGDVSKLDTPQKVEQEAASPELEREREEEGKRGSSLNPGNNSTEAAQEDAAMSEDEEENKGVVVIVEDGVSSKVLALESDESVITRIYH